MKPMFFRVVLSLFLAAIAAPAADKTPATRIALISDIHIQRGTNEAQRILHAKHFDQAIAQVNAAGVDLVLMAGDLTENGTPEEMRDFMAQAKGLKAPIWLVPGNHDIGNKIFPDKDGKIKNTGLTEWRLARYEMHHGPTFFARELPGLRVIGVNAPICGSDFRREKTMWQFLEKKLAKPANKPTILFLHFPPFVKQANEPGGVYWNLEPLPRQRLLSLVRQGDVKAVLSGHMHTENMSRYDGVLYVTSPPVAFGLPKGKQPEGWTFLTVSPDGKVDAEFRYLKQK